MERKTGMEPGKEKGVMKYSRRKYLEFLGVLQLRKGSITALNIQTNQTYLQLGAINKL